MTRPGPGYAAQQMADPVAQADYPPQVATIADRVRWDNAATVARDVLGDTADEADVWMLTRTMYADRESYPD